jgi:hypothetical protein
MDHEQARRIAAKGPDHEFRDAVQLEESRLQSNRRSDERRRNTPERIEYLRRYRAMVRAERAMRLHLGSGE